MYNPFNLVGKTILITGASSGIGKSIAIECSRMGAIVVITGRNRNRLDLTFTALEGSSNLSIVCDLEDIDQKKALIERLPTLDGIVHCAGISNFKPIQFLKKEDFDNMFSINFFAPSQITIDLLKVKKIRKNSSIVFIASIMGILTSYYGGALYSSTKGALNGIIKGMALDLAPKKIRVNGIMPAMVKTDIINNGTLTEEQIEMDTKKYPLGRYGTPEEVAYAAIYLLSDASSWTTGSNILLDGGRTISY